MGEWLGNNESEKGCDYVGNELEEQGHKIEERKRCVGQQGTGKMGLG